MRSVGYIVRLKKDGQRTTRDAARGLARRHAVTPTHVFEESIRGFSMGRVPEHVVARLLGDDLVEAVEPDLAVEACGQQIPWSISRVVWGQSSVVGPDAAVDAHIFILDTGVQKDHPDLNVVESLSFHRTKQVPTT